MRTSPLSRRSSSVTFTSSFLRIITSFSLRDAISTISYISYANTVTFICIFPLSSTYTSPSAKETATVQLSSFLTSIVSGNGFTTFALVSVSALLFSVCVLQPASRLKQRISVKIIDNVFFIVYVLLYISNYFLIALCISTSAKRITNKTALIL